MTVFSHHQSYITLKVKSRCACVGVDVMFPLSCCCSLLFLLISFLTVEICSDSVCQLMWLARNTDERRQCGADRAAPAEPSDSTLDARRDVDADNPKSVEVFYMCVCVCWGAGGACILALLCRRIVKVVCQRMTLRAVGQRSILCRAVCPVSISGNQTHADC